MNSLQRAVRTGATKISFRNLASASATPLKEWLVLRGTIIHSKGLSELEIRDNVYVGVQRSDDKGTIRFVEESKDNIDQSLLQNCEFVDLGDRFLVPGFIDTHTHAPQYVFTGGGRIPLLEWLETYTFPTEAKFKDVDYAGEVYSKAVQRHIRSGTTTCCYYGTIHLEATMKLADIVHGYGQRGYIGKVCMDQNSPANYVETTEESLANTRAFCDELKKRDYPHVKPIITPRFAPTCSSKLLRGLGDLSAERDLHIQSHISENKDEVEWVKQLFPDCTSYSDVYDKHGLLTEKSIMAHAVYLSAAERALFKKRNASVSHCPNSNYSIGSGVLDVRRLLKDGIKVGLGTDVAGGYSPSMLDAMRQTIIAAKSSEFFRDGSLNYSHHGERPDKDAPGEKPIAIDHKQAFYLATLGGAKVICQEEALGNFEVGKEFDALVVDPSAPGSPFDVFSTDSITDIFQKFIFLGDDRNISSVFVSGTRILSQE